MFSTEYTSIQYEEPTLKMNKLKCAYLRVASLQEIRIEGFSMYRVIYRVMYRVILISVEWLPCIQRCLHFSELLIPSKLTP